MNLALIVVALIIVSASFIGNKITTLNKENLVPSEESEVLSEETETSTPTESAKPTETPTMATTQASTVKPTQSPAPTNAPVNNDNSGWMYPNSSVISQGSTLVLESTDSTDQITDWYRNKIESEGFNVRSSVKTSANDNIKNVISAAKNNANVNVEITKGPSDSKARIEVESSL